MKELPSSVTEISRKVQRHDEILNSRGATDQSRVKDRGFELHPDPKFTSLQHTKGQVYGNCISLEHHTVDGAERLMPTASAPPT